MVAIKDMKEIPKTCCDEDKLCPLFDEETGTCNGVEEFIMTDTTMKRFPNCPLVEVKEHKVGKCTDCNEYNQEKHYCPKFCDVIRDTTTEMQEYYKGEHEKLERIGQIIKEWKEDTEWDMEMYDTLEEISKVLEQE